MESRLNLRERVWTAMIAFVIMTMVAVPGARADELEKIERLAEKAMERFDSLDYEAAKKLLNAAVAKAKTAGLDSEPLVARVYLDLGIVYFSGENDVDSARVVFIDAVKIDPDIEIEPAYKTGDMQALLDEVKEEFGKKKTGSGAKGDACAAVEGLEHTLIDTADAGEDVPVTARLGSDVQAARVKLFYRMHGVPGAGVDFSEESMKQEGACTFSASIPGSAIKGGVIHYYIAALDKGGKTVAESGSEKTPNLIEVRGGDAENPLVRKKRRSGPRKVRFFVTLAAGSGGAYVTGETEQARAPINCCVAPALLHAAPEIGYILSSGTSLSVAARVGFPIGANLLNHATAAPAAFVRLRKPLSGSSLFWTAALGGGVIRQTVALNNGQGEVDTSAIGPLLVGGGVGYARALGGTMRFVAEVNVTSGVPVVGTLGTAILNFGVQVDANLGMQLAF